MTKMYSVHLDTRSSNLFMHDSLRLASGEPAERNPWNARVRTSERRAVQHPALGLGLHGHS